MVTDAFARLVAACPRSGEVGQSKGIVVEFAEGRWGDVDAFWWQWGGCKRLKLAPFCTNLGVYWLGETGGCALL